MEVRLTRVGAAVLAGALVLQVGLARPARADEAAPLLTVAKTTLFGGLIGLVLGGVTALVVDSEDRDDAIRWGIVVGSFGGFGYGIWAVSHGSEDDFFGQVPPPEDTLRSDLLLARAGVGERVRWTGPSASASGATNHVGSMFRPISSVALHSANGFPPRDVHLDGISVDTTVTRIHS